jgi:UDP-glucose 4-epimerase
MGKVLVTGGAGFLGSHLVDHLVARGHQVVVLDDLSGGLRTNVNRKARFIEGSITSEKAVDQAMKRVDIVYHLAADAREGLSFFRPVHTANTNFVGSSNLIRAAVMQGVDRFVFTSSMARYGSQPKLPFVESMTPTPQDPYGLGKLMVEKLLAIYHEVFGLDYSVLIPHNIYGPRQYMRDPYRNVIAIFMNRILHGKGPLVYGDGKQVRDFSYVSDCVPVIAKAGTDRRALNDVFNIGPDSDPITLNELARRVIDVTGFDGRPAHLPARPGEVKFAWCSSSKARRLLGYRPRVGLDAGLKTMWGWAKAHGAQRWNYLPGLEIENELTPAAWRDRLI